MSEQDKKTETEVETVEYEFLRDESGKVIQPPVITKTTRTRTNTRPQ